MKNLLIIGAGAFGREIYNIAIKCIGYNKDFSIKGFLDDNQSALDNFKNYPPIIGTINDYEIAVNDVFVCATGNIAVKKKIASIILTKGGSFINLIHSTAMVALNVNLITGCIIGPNVSIGADAQIGDFTLLQTGTIIGHDAIIGDWSRIDSYAVIIGGVKIGTEAVIHTGAIINHDVIIEDNACVGAGSFVIRNVKKGTTVFGNPAKPL